MTEDQSPQGDTTPLEKIEAEGSKPPIERNPLREIVANLTDNTSSKLKRFLLPPKEGLIFVIGPLAYQIKYINQGQMRFTSEFYGFLEKDGTIVRPGGEIDNRLPKPHEVGRNPNNVTLDVHSGSIDANSFFGPRSKDGQNPTS